MSVVPAIAAAVPILWLLALIPVAGAQDGFSNVTCTRASWEVNSVGQSPCYVWGQLQSLCLPGIIVVPLQNTSYQYYPPSRSGEMDACNCNVVSYNLMAACSWCQTDILTTNWVTEEEWSVGCSPYDSDGISVDVSTLTIPEWAYLPDNGASWNPTTVEAAAVGSGSAASTLASLTQSSTSTASTTPAASPSSSDGAAPGKSGSSAPVGAIVGGVIGGIAVLAILAVLLFFRLRHRKKLRARATSPVELAPPPDPTPYFIQDDRGWHDGHAPVTAPLLSSQGSDSLSSGMQHTAFNQPSSFGMAYADGRPGGGQQERAPGVTSPPPYQPNALRSYPAASSSSRSAKRMGG